MLNTVKSILILYCLYTCRFSISFMSLFSVTQLSTVQELFFHTKNGLNFACKFNQGKVVTIKFKLYMALLGSETISLTQKETTCIYFPTRMFTLQTFYFITFGFI